MTERDTFPSAHPTFVRYPSQAAFGRTLPKSKLYVHSHAGARLKTLFVQQVEQIVWQFKLAPETINLPARPAVLPVRLVLLAPECRLPRSAPVALCRWLHRWRSASLQWTASCQQRPVVAVPMRDQGIRFREHHRHDSQWLLLRHQSLLTKTSRLRHHPATPGCLGSSRSGRTSLPIASSTACLTMALVRSAEYAPAIGWPVCGSMI